MWRIRYINDIISNVQFYEERDREKEFNENYMQRFCKKRERNLRKCNDKKIILAFCTMIKEYPRMLWISYYVDHLK